MPVKTEHPAIRVVALDADGVVQTPVDWRERLTAVLEAAGTRPDEQAIEAFLSDIFSADESALVGDADFEVELPKILQRWQIDRPIADVLSIWTDIEPNRTILATVDELRKQGLRVCLATNQHRLRGEFMHRTLDYRNRFNQSFYSYQIGARKPQPQFFRHMIQALGCAPDEILFVDDKATNVEQARTEGLRSRVVTNHEQIAEELAAALAGHLDSRSRRITNVSTTTEPTSVTASSLPMPESDTPPVLALRGLSKVYKNVQALRQLNLTVDEGRVYGFLGRNGAGKSTAMRIIMGINRASSGTVELFGEPAHGYRVRQQIGYVAQEQHFYGWMDALGIGRFVSGFYPNWDSTEYHKLLKALEVPTDRKLHTFSGGMHAKLALALVLAHRPRLLLLDEPTAGMDAVARREFFEIVHDQATRDGRTTLFSSHLIDEVEVAADTVGIIHDGQMLYEGSLAALQESVFRLRTESQEATGLPAWLDHPGVSVLRDEPTTDGREVILKTELGALSDTLAQANADDSPWRMERLSLEDIFVAMVTRRFDI